MPSVPNVPPTLCSLFTLESAGSIALMVTPHRSGSPSHLTSQVRRSFPANTQSPAVAVAIVKYSISSTGALVKWFFLKLIWKGTEAPCSPVPWRGRGLPGGLHAASIHTFAPLSLETEKHTHASREERVKPWNKNSMFKGLISVLFLVISALH